MKKKIGSFVWEKGSINDNIRKILINKCIGYYNTFNGDIFTSESKKVSAEYQENDLYFVFINY